MVLSQSDGLQGERTAIPPLERLTAVELFALSRACLRELKRRGVVRSNNAPVGDLAEFLVQRVTGGTLADRSQKSWDIRTPNGERLQVKARVVTDPRNPGERQLSVFRSWDFDAAVIVLFDDEGRVWRAARVPTATLQANAYLTPHVNGQVVYATDALLTRPEVEDWATSVRRVAGENWQ